MFRDFELMFCAKMHHSVASIGVCMVMLSDVVDAAECGVSRCDASAKKEFQQLFSAIVLPLSTTLF